ncbi:MAG: PIN domain-containing protein [Thaumarchaeota archaeon]|nr:PIN domain-containing protein [Nitrososphaerota archaeon]
MRIFLDTSLLSDIGLLRLSDDIISHLAEGDSFYESVITHFQILWGYSAAGRSTARYETFLQKTWIEVVPLTKSDAEEAASHKPNRSDILDALIGATVKRYDATIWTKDRDFLRFLPRDKARIIR